MRRRRSSNTVYIHFLIAATSDNDIGVRLTERHDARLPRLVFKRPFSFEIPADTDPVLSSPLSDSNRSRRALFNLMTRFVSS
ncbi:hypothetical protein F2P81_011473 [Scophthalmus maximus]|uniref:Uncharacterized protein n=1 Tax=Scophthalmus maximus TaxID=52904 RepID=A0A6A4SYR7_SCOMX|nr:hypothetical protein F2P81_011473 [Scophthalmus maximus]